jgi:TRAP-type transport system small permease protein
MAAAGEPVRSDMEGGAAASPFDRFCNLYLRWSLLAVKVIAVSVLGAMVAMNAIEILSRAVWNVSLNWVQELSVVVAMTLYFLGYALVAKEQAYLAIGTLGRSLPPTLARGLGLLLNAGVLVFHAAVAVLAFRILPFVGMFDTPILNLPETVYILPIAIGCADIAVTETIFLIRRIAGRPMVEQARVGVLT